MHETKFGTHFVKLSVLYSCLNHSRLLTSHIIALSIKKIHPLH